MTAAPACTFCKAELPLEFINTDELHECPSCDSQVQVEVFPAFFRPLEKGAVGEALVVDTNASCFYHTQKQAAVLCAGCGRFLCSLCDVEFEGQHLCPPCLETGQKGGKFKSLESRRVLNDTIAFHLSLLSFFVFYISFITAPLALYWAIKHWKTPSSILHRRRIRFVLAIALSSLQILAWIAFIIVFVAT